MKDEEMETEQYALLPAHTTSGTADDDPDTPLNIALQTSPVSSHDGDKWTEVASASATSNSGIQSEACHGERDMEVPGRNLSRSQEKKRKKREAGKDRRINERDDAQEGDRNVDDGTEQVLAEHPTPKRLPPSRLESSPANPTKTSLALQTEKLQPPRSSNLPWTPAGSASWSRPGSPHQSQSFGLLHRPYSQNSEGPKRSGSLRSVSCESEEGPALTEPKSQENETEIENKEHAHGKAAAAELSTSDFDLLSELGNSPVDSQFQEMGPVEHTAVCHPDMLEENINLQNQLDQANEGYHYLNEELVGLREDINHICNAWRKACSAASLDSEAVLHFQSLVTDSDIDEDSRTAAHKELAGNALCLWINDTLEILENLRQESNRKDETMSNPENDTLAGNETLQHVPADWRYLYEKEQQRAELLKAQNKRIKEEAEGLYQGDLERTCKQLKADLIEAQDRVIFLTTSLDQQQEETLSWQNEAIQHKNELDQRLMQFEEQSHFQKEEMLRVVQEYRGKVQDSKHWDTDGLVLENERLWREQTVLAEELERINESNSSKDNQIERLLDKQEQDQKEIKELRRTLLAGNINALLTTQDDKGIPSRQDVMSELREKQRMRREEEDTKEALKEKVRRLRMGDRYPPAQLGWQNLVGQEWSTRWKANELLVDLTEEERAYLKKL